MKRSTSVSVFLVPLVAAALRATPAAADGPCATTSNCGAPEKSKATHGGFGGSFTQQTVTG